MEMMEIIRITDSFMFKLLASNIFLIVLLLTPAVSMAEKEVQRFKTISSSFDQSGITHPKAALMIKSYIH